MPAKKNNNFKKGFTVIELIIVMGMMVTLTSMITINLMSSQKLASLSATIMVLRSDLKQQQLKAMDGDSANGTATPSNHGIHFESNKYTLFNNTYNASNTTNFVVNMDSNISIATTGEIVFTKGNGEIGKTMAITLRDSFNYQKTLNINPLGVVTND